MMNIAEMSLEEIKMEIEKSLREKGCPSIELLMEFDKKLDELDEAQGIVFNVSVINSKREEVDRIEVKSCDEGRALLKAQDIFTEKHENYTVADAGMFLGSKTRDLCVEIDGTDKYEDFQLIICE